MTDLETKLCESLDAYAADTTAAVSPPSVESISAAASRHRRRLARWTKAAASLVGGLVVTAGVATAFGVLPTPVSSMVREMQSWGFDVSEDEAARLASVSKDDMTYELWVVPGRGGDQCVYVRVIRAGVDMENGGAARCDFDEPSPPSAFVVLGGASFSAPSVDRMGRHPTIAGRLPVGATHLVVDFSDGTKHRVAAERGGYFVTIVPPGLLDGTTVLSLRATTADGETVAVQFIPKPAAR